MTPEPVKPGCDRRATTSVKMSWFMYTQSQP
jgi:hypothetical protein